MRTALLLLSFALAGAGASAFAHEKATLQVRTMVQDSVPKYIQHADGTISGLAVDIMQALEQQDGALIFTYDSVMTPFPRILYELNHDRIDAFIGAIYTEERAEKLTYLQPALYSTSNRLVVVKQDADLNITSLQDIRALGRNGIILVDRGTAHQQFLQQEAGLRLDAGADQREQNLQKLLSGRARFYYSTDLGVLHTAQQMHITSQIAMLPLVLKTEPQYLVMSANAAPELKQRLQQALQALVQNGKLRAITQRYFAVESAEKTATQVQLR